MLCDLGHTAKRHALIASNALNLGSACTILTPKSGHKILLFVHSKMKWKFSKPKNPNTQNSPVSLRKTDAGNDPGKATTRSFAVHPVHILASICSAGFLAFLPLALYCAWVIPAAVSAADLGGPLNFIIIPLLGGLVGIALSIVVYFPLSLLAVRFNFTRWFRLVGILTALLTLIVLSALIWGGISNAQHHCWPASLVIGSIMCLYAVGGFFVYLSCHAVFRKMSP